VRPVNGWALGQSVDAATGTARLDSDLRVMKAHFLNNLKEVQPAFGIEEEVLETLATRGICDYSDDFVNKRRNLIRLIEALQQGQHVSLSTFLIYGLSRTGLTTVAVLHAKEGFGYVKAIIAKQFIVKTFEIYLTMPIGVPKVQNIWIIIEFPRLGPRLANNILPSILVLLRCLAQKGYKLAVFVTTSGRDAMKVIGVTSRYVSQEMQLTPLFKLSEIENVATEMSEAVLEFETDERAEAAKFFNEEHKNGLSIKRALGAIDLTVFEAKWQLQQIQRDQVNLTYESH
jgi:hypothetical protein